MRLGIKKALAVVTMLSLVMQGSTDIASAAKKASVSISNAKQTITVGEKTTLKLKKKNIKKVKSVKWTTTTKDIILVSSKGVVYGKKAGMGKVKATVKYIAKGKKKATKKTLKCNINVVAKTQPTAKPTVVPTVKPTVEPTAEPTMEPTIAPTMEPTIAPTLAPIHATIVSDEHATVDVYYTQEYDKDADVINASSAVVRNGDTGEIDSSGEGQISFKVNAEEGYSVGVEVTPTENYKNLKLPKDTLVDNVYRVTKIKGDITITITAVKEMPKLKASFVTDEHATIDVYYTQEYDGDADEINVTETLARDGSTGEISGLGEGQVSFKVNAEEGYNVLVQVTPTEHYKNLKLPAETLAENVYRITKITGDITVTVTTAKELPKYKASFDVDEHATIDVYYTQNYAEAADDIDVTEAYARDSEGEIDASGEGQVSFKVNVEDGYEVTSVEVAPKNYKNLKTPTDTLFDNVYRITKVSGDITIKVTVALKEDSVTE